MDYERIILEANARRRGLLDEVAKLDALIASASALAGRPMQSQSVAFKGTSTGRAAGSVMSPTREETRTALRTLGRPIQTRDLVPILEGKGISIGGKDKVATLSARLSNSQEFIVHRGIGWWFKGEPVPGDMNFEEAAGQPAKQEPAASNTNQGGSKDAAALVSDPDRE